MTGTQEIQDEMCILTFERLRDVLSYCRYSGSFIWKVNKGNVRIGDVAGTTGKDRYVRIRIDRKRYFAHRLAWLYVNGKWPCFEIDHINRDPSDNSYTNLRDIPHHENKQNMVAQKGNRSGIKGITWDATNKVWKSRICLKGKDEFLGNFKSPQDAEKAYSIAANKVHKFNPSAQLESGGYISEGSLL